MNIAMTKKLAGAALRTAVLAWIGTTAVAQTDNTVTIKFDDGLSITGVLLEAIEGTVRLETISGAITIPLDGATCSGVACPGAAAPATAASGRSVVLTSLDGGTKMQGDLLRVEDGDYVLTTIIGEMRAPIDQVSCQGAGCVEPEPEHELGGKVALSSGETILEGTLIGLDDENYVVDMALFGELRVPRLFVCNGEGCPPE